MIKENKAECVVMFVSFIICIALVYGVARTVSDGNNGLGILCALFAVLALVMHGRSSADVAEKEWIGKPIPYDMLDSNVAIKVVEKIGEVYCLVVLCQHHNEEDGDRYARIVKDLPQEVASVGCIFFINEGELNSYQRFGDGSVRIGRRMLFKQAE